MLGNMMNTPLLISAIFDYATDLHADQEIVSRRVEGDIHRYSYRDFGKRCGQLANALLDLGVDAGDRVATLAWNGYRHLEIYYAVSGLGAITHTVNPRLFSEQIDYIINHAEDSVVFVDLTFVSLLEEIVSKLPTVKHYVVLTDRRHMPDTTLPNAICYEELIAGKPAKVHWPVFDENTAACLCYTSGTTGNPKGVLYSHRSTVLHALASVIPNGLNMSRDTVVLPVVPMYHVAAWGIPYSGLMVGAKLVLPGAGTDGASLFELIDNEKASLLLGVPTVWLTLLNHLEGTGKTLDSVRTVANGGSAPPLALAKNFEEKHNVYLMPMWGMTETSPLAVFVSRDQSVDALPLEQRYQLQTKAGRPIFGIDLEIFDDNDKPLPHDGTAYGNLKVRGPWVIQRYFKQEKDTVVDGWFDTGDVATIDGHGYMQVVDRKKDVIKSGGEWISSIELENAALSHAAVREACVVGVRHPKWDERPLLFVVLKQGQSVDKQELLNLLATKVAKWWLPDDVIYLDELPHTATGKLLKMKLRDQYIDYLASKK
jgi:acyl-CoA synthetase (AMP-forming)/AMP-acid ligase II